MGKFTDSSYFLIDHYLQSINKPIEEDITTQISSLWPVIFTDTDESIEWSDENNVFWNFEYEHIEGSYTHTSPSYENSYLMGPRTGLVTKGGRVIELYVKDENYGFRKINVSPPWDDHKNGNFFNFHKHITLPYQYGSTLTETVSGEYYYFEIYTPNVTFDPDSINGKEVYFRKDSQFHNWLINTARDYFIDLWGEDFIIRNYVNTDKQFLYFGKIYHKQDEEYHIEFYGMKDFVTKAIPEHQRTPNLIEYFNVSFDRVNQEIYNLLKNIWSMIDPYEVDEKFLGYLAEFYNINVDNQSIDVINQREFIREMVQYLKRKGSYSSFYAVWKVLTQGTKNELSVYEKWIDKNDITLPPSGTYTLPPSLSVFQEVLYTDQYTTTFPLSGNVEDYMLTPYYKIQADLSTEPMEFSKILSENVINSLLYQWENLRPANKVAEYEITLNPEVDLTGAMAALYEGKPTEYDTNVLSRVSKFSIAVEGSYIHVFGGDFTSFLVNHNLNTNHLFVRCYNMDFEEIIPSRIHFEDHDNIRVTFAEPLNGFILVKKPDQTIIQLSELDGNWRVKHSHLQKELNIEFNQDDEKIYHDELVLIDEEFFESNVKSGAVNISKPDLVFMQSTPDTEWNVNHELGYKGLLINCFDLDNNEILPKNIKFNDINNSVIMFEEPIAGYAIMTSVGNPLFADMLLEEVGGEYLLPFYEISSVKDNFATPADYKQRVTSSYETDDALYLTLDLPFGQDFSIREIRIYDSNENILIYTECGEIYKPMNVKMKIKYKINKYITKGSL